MVVVMKGVKPKWTEGQLFYRHNTIRCVSRLLVPQWIQKNANRKKNLLCTDRSSFEPTRPYVSQWKAWNHLAKDLSFCLSHWMNYWICLPFWMSYWTYLSHWRNYSDTDSATDDSDVLRHPHTQPSSFKREFMGQTPKSSIFHTDNSYSVLHASIPLVPPLPLVHKS